MEPTHRWIEHTAELQLELHAGSEAAVFGQAVHALRELLEDDEPADGPRVERSVEAEATDRGALLAEGLARRVLPPAPDGLLGEWLSELVFLAETEGLVPDEARNLVVGEYSVSAVVIGRTGEPRHLV